jgi:methyl-accepting chemotaxis protein
MATEPAGPGRGINGSYPSSPGALTRPAPVDSVARNTESLERFARSFEASARRWELVVYPSLFAFIVLAAYGFFLVYSLTQDVSSLARSVDQLTVSVSSMSDNMGTVSSRMQAVSLNMDEIAHKLGHLSAIRASVENMDRSTQLMAVTTDAMRHHVTGMNLQMAGMTQSIRPMRAMASMLPW